MQWRIKGHTSFIANYKVYFLQKCLVVMNVTYHLCVTLSKGNKKGKVQKLIAFAPFFASWTVSFVVHIWQPCTH